MSEFASKWPDMLLWATTRARTQLGSIAVSAERDEKKPVQVVVSVALAQLETPVSRNCLVTLECWAATKGEAMKLASDAGYAIESAPRNSSPVVRTSLNSGPNQDRDEAGTYFFTVVVNVVAHRLP